MYGLKSRSEREIDMLFVMTETNTGPIDQFFLSYTSDPFPLTIGTKDQIWIESEYEYFLYTVFHKYQSIKLFNETLYLIEI